MYILTVQNIINIYFLQLELRVARNIKIIYLSQICRETSAPTKLKLAIIV
jgi:hypothetical protein